MALINIKDYAQFSNNNENWSEAFAKAVEDVVAAGGGTLYVPAGLYKTRSIELKSNMTLYLEAGSELSFLDDIDNYEVITGNFEGITRDMYKPCIYMYGAENVTIKGQGVLNGNGAIWWQRIREKSLEIARPCLVYFEHCERIRLEGVKLMNSPAWTVHPLFSNNVVVDGVSIWSPSDSCNTDGINPDSCTNVRIANCIIDVGDDCIAIKSGVEQSDVFKPCENITITNCNMIHGHGGVVIGSEASGNVRNVTVSNCVFQDTDRGIRLKTRRRRGGKMEKLTFANIIMERVMCPFVFNMYYFCGKLGKEPWVSDPAPAPVDGGTPEIQDLNINNITVTNATSCAGVFAGLPEQHIRNITLSNVNVTMCKDKEPEVAAMMARLDPMQAGGFVIRNAEGIVFQNVTLNGVEGAHYLCDDGSDYKIV